MNSFDVIVVGQGVMGLATSYSLSLKGAKTLGLEQYSLFHNLGSSHGETRAIRMAYFEHPNYIPLLQSSYKLWETLEEKSSQILFNKCGLLFMSNPLTSTLSPSIKKSAVDYNIPLESLDATSLQKRFPFFEVRLKWHLI